MAKKPRAEAFVLDGSVALAWCFDDEDNPYADAVVDCFPGTQAFVPSLWPLEVANALLIGERRKRSTQADTATWIMFLKSLSITVDDETVMRAWSDMTVLARDYKLSVYDASYLELAIRRRLPLATLDNELKAAATAAGVAAYTP